MFYFNVIINYSFITLITHWTLRLNTKMAASTAASLAQSSILSIEEMPSSKRHARKDRKRAKSNGFDSDCEFQPNDRKSAKNQFKISEILRNYQLRNFENSPDKLLAYVPEPVKDVFVPYIKHVKMINSNLELISSLFKANGQSLRPDLMEKFNDFAKKTGSQMERLSGDLIEQLASNYSQDTVYEKIKASCQEPIVQLDKIEDPEEKSVVNKSSIAVDDYDEFMDSDIDLQISEICDNVTSGAKNNDTVNVERSVLGNSSNECFKQPNSTNRHLEGLQYDSDGYLLVYTDGCCLSNGKSNAQAGIGVWFNHNHSLNVAAPAYGTPTNNNAEIQAATKAILIASENDCKKIRICTDSMFLINCMTTWVKNWKRNNWKTAEKQPVKNRESLEELDSSMKLMDSVEWKHIPGHRGCPGNEGADTLAKQGALLYRR